MKVSPENAVAELNRVHEVLRLLRKEFGEWQKEDFPLMGFDVLRSWYCVRAHPGADVKLASDLSDQEYETFLPLTFAKEMFGERSIAVPKLRFSPYVFVAVDHTRQAFHPITETIGYDDVLSFRFGEVAGVRTAQPSIVPREVILGMRRDQDEDYEAATRRVRKEESLYRPGDPIRVVLDGAFKDREFKVDEARRGAVTVRCEGGYPLRLKESDIVPVYSKLLKERSAARAEAETAARQKASAAA
jgi:transcription antitermination factor NusG